GTVDAEAWPGRARQPRRHGDVLESWRPVFAHAEIAEQARDRAAKDLRGAVILLAAGRGARPGRIVIDVVDDDEVEPAVAVEFEEVGRGAPERVPEAGLFADVLELAAAA